MAIELSQDVSSIHPGLSKKIFQKYEHDYNKI